MRKCVQRCGCSRDCNKTDVTSSDDVIPSVASNDFIPGVRRSDVISDDVNGEVVLKRLLAQRLRRIGDELNMTTRFESLLNRRSTSLMTSRRTSMYDVNNRNECFIMLTASMSSFVNIQLFVKLASSVAMWLLIIFIAFLLHKTRKSL